MHNEPAFRLRLRERGDVPRQERARIERALGGRGSRRAAISKAIHGSAGASPSLDLLQPRARGSKSRKCRGNAETVTETVTQFLRILLNSFSANFRWPPT